MCYSTLDLDSTFPIINKKSKCIKIRNKKYVIALRVKVHLFLI